MESKNRWNDNAENNNGSAIIVIAIIAFGVISWQFILPAFGLPGFSDFIGATEPTPTTITFGYGLFYNDEQVSVVNTVEDYVDIFNDFDRVSHTYPAYDIDDEIEIPNYVLKITTNAPGQILDPYTIDVKTIIYHIEAYSQTETDVLHAEINAFSNDIKTFSVPFDTEYVTQYLSQYTEIIMRLYDGGGNLLKTLHLVIV